MKAELGSDTRVVATGGLAPLISRESKFIEAVEPDLTLEGMRLVFERNAESRSADVSAAE